MSKRDVALVALFLGTLLTTTAPAQTGAIPSSSTDASDNEVTNSSAGEWTTDQISGCKLWNDHPKSSETVRWSGTCPNGLATGNGTAQWFRDGKPGETSTADYVDGKRTGKGVIVYSNGNRYEGDFVENKRSGKGVFTWKNGNHYEGEYVGGRRTGKGVFTTPDGCRLEGDFANGKLYGKGTARWPNGDQYEGDFVRGKLTRKGVWTAANGDRYEGFFINGKKTREDVYNESSRFDQFQKSAASSIDDAIKESAYNNPRLNGRTTARAINDLGNLEIPTYVDRVVHRAVMNNWYHLISDSEENFSHRNGNTTVLVTITRKGGIEDARISSSSGQDDLDQLALESVLFSSPVQPLPKAFKGKELKVKINFSYMGTKEPSWKGKQ
jgi:TonB family protein